MIESKKKLWGDILSTCGSKLIELQYPLPDGIIDNTKNYLFELAIELQDGHILDAQKWIQMNPTINQDRQVRRLLEVYFLFIYLFIYLFICSIFISFSYFSFFIYLFFISLLQLVNQSFEWQMK